MAVQHVGAPLLAATLGADTHTTLKISSFHKTNRKLGFMKRATPLILPLLRTRAQGDILAAVLLRPEEEQSLSDVARLVDVSPATVLREIDRLEEAGLVSTRRLGNTRLARARTDNPVYAPLAELLAVTFGPLAVLRGLLADVEDITHAFIYGSWAARYHEQPGSVPGDIDVLVPRV